MKVLVLGGTGYIGLPVAQAFVRNGHEVYVSSRTSAKSAALCSDEIIPLVGDAWIQQAALFEVIIDCASSGPDGAKAAFGAAVNAAKSRAPHYKITFIYCGGTWVHGNPEQREGRLTDERAPVKISPDLVAWRPAVEQLVLASSDVDGIVIRPGLLYGRSMSLLEALFEQAKAGKIDWMNKPAGRYGLIHQDDLADLFLRVAEAAPICKGLTFDGVNMQSENVDDIIAALATVSGCKEVTTHAPTNPFETAMTTQALTHPSLARALLGWQPKKLGLVDGMNIYYPAWLGSKMK